MAGQTSDATNTDAPICVSDVKAESKCAPSPRSVGSSPLCPQCGSKKVWKNAHRTTAYGEKIQRWSCRDCGLRFSDPTEMQGTLSNREKQAKARLTNDIKTPANTLLSNQVCVTETKNLSAEQQQFEVLRRTEPGEYTQKIAEYEIWLRSNGRSEATVFGRVKLLRRLVKRGAILYDPDSVKRKIADQKWCNGQKNNAVDAYSSFLKMVGGTWEPPAYETIRKIPFIPKETEIDQLIAGSSRRMAIFLQILKETGARCGEIWQLKWIDIDFESKVINITPEKNSNPRVAHLSNKLIEMLQHLPRNYGDRVFSNPGMRQDNFAVNFQRQRKRTANKIKNPRLMQIHFHTFRYWKGTMLYHETKDIYYVMTRLGHKNIKNTLLYIQLEEALFQGENEYICKVAKTEKEICELVEAGFQFVTDFQDAKIFKKRK